MKEKKIIKKQTKITPHLCDFCKQRIKIKDKWRTIPEWLYQLLEKKYDCSNGMCKKCLKKQMEILKALEEEEKNETGYAYIRRW